MEPRYTLDGEIVVAKEYAVDLDPNVIERNPNPSTAVMLYALDEQGEKLFNLQIGFAKVSIAEGRVVVPAGTVVKLEPIHMSDKRAAEYLQIKSLKLDFKKYTK